MIFQKVREKIAFAMCEIIEYKRITYIAIQKDKRIIFGKHN